MGIAEGYYNALAKCWGLSETKAGHPQYQIEFELSDDAGGVVGTLNWFGSLKEGQAEEITVQALRDCGWTGNDITKVELPNTVRVKVADEEFNGVVRTKIKGIYVAGSAVKKMDAANERSFADRFRGRLAQIDQRNKQHRSDYQAQREASPAPRTSGQSPDGDSGDIPF